MVLEGLVCVEDRFALIVRVAEPPLEYTFLHEQTGFVGPPAPLDNLSG